MKSLNEVASFGGIDAEADALLDECFQDHEAYLKVLSHERPLVLGRKGSGKTAIFRKIILARKHDFFCLWAHFF